MSIANPAPLTCPHCGSDIRPGISVCPHCHRDPRLTQKQHERATRPRMHPIVFWLLVLFAAGFLIMLIDLIPRLFP